MPLPVLRRGFSTLLLVRFVHFPFVPRSRRDHCLTVFFEQGLSAQVPEGRRLFPFMTVRENLELGAFNPRARAARDQNLEKVFALMPRLRERANQLAGSMSGGEQQMCAIGRALMAMPRMIMFDEPTLGLAPIMVDTVFKLVREIKATGATILIVEQNVRHSLALSERGYVLENGRIALHGPADQLLNDPRLKEAYLGG